MTNSKMPRVHSVKTTGVPSPVWRFGSGLRMFGRAEWTTPQSIGLSGISEMTGEPSARPAMITFVLPAELALCQQLFGCLFSFLLFRGEQTHALHRPEKEEIIRLMIPHLHPLSSEIRLRGYQYFWQSLRRRLT